MSEDAFVRMLLEAADGVVTDERDVDLARAAATWALQPASRGGGGWRSYLDDGFLIARSGLQYWVSAAAYRGRLIVMVRLEPGTCWRQHGQWQIADLGHALNVLANERLLPARFCTLGREALEDHAEALDRAAERLMDGPDATVMTDWACGLAEAAASARRFSAGQLAVLV